MAGARLDMDAPLDVPGRVDIDALLDVWTTVAVAIALDVLDDACVVGSRGRYAQGSGESCRSRQSDREGAACQCSDEFHSRCLHSRGVAR
jgi:hypothetical protein